MATEYSPSQNVRDALRNHLATQHVGAASGSSVGTVASAAALNVAGKRVAFVTGTTGITSLTGGKQGQIVTLHFAGSLTVTHGTTTIRLPGGTNFSATANDTLTLLCTDETAGAQVWVQIAQANNT